MSTDCCLLKIKNGCSSKDVYKTEQVVTDWKNILGKYKLAQGHASRKHKKLLQSSSNKNTQMKMLEWVFQQRRCSVGK